MASLLGEDESLDNEFDDAPPPPSVIKPTRIITPTINTEGFGSEEAVLQKVSII